MTEYNFEIQQGETPFNQLVRISVDKLNKLHDMDWLEVKEQFGFDQSAESLRKYARGWKLLSDNAEAEEMGKPDVSQIKYKETTEVLHDGSHKSDKLVSMSAEQSKDVNYLLEAHGFDSSEWELSNAKNSMWNMNSATEGVQTLFSSKITVKPRGNGFNMDKLLETIRQETNVITVETPRMTDEKLLEIPLFDMHFGIADLDYYMNTLDKIKKKIHSAKWDTVVFVIGQDLFHNDGFTGQTTSGTMIDKVNMEEAWEDADTFYSILIRDALQNSKKVNIIFSSGNHDQAIGFAFVKMLQAKFTQAKFDTEMRQRKGFTWNNLFLGFSHGDKGANRIEKNFLAEHGKAIAEAKIVEIHTGHYHSEKTKDDYGIVVRTLATKAKTDDWHLDNGFIGSMKRFQLFEYSKDSLEAIHYV